MYIEFRRNAGAWGFLAIDTNSPYDDDTPLLAAPAPETREYRMRFWDGRRTGKMPGTAIDSCGMACDAKRDRMLLLTLGGYSKPYDGQIHALDLKTLKVAPLDPQGMNTSKSWRILLREAAFDPAADLMILPQLLDRQRKAVPDQTLAYDAAGNRWVLIETPGATARPFSAGSVNTSIAYDPKRKLLWCGDASWDGGIRVLRLDPATAKITAVMPE